jgi:hypothetical protein
LFGARDVPEGLRDVSADGWHAERDVARAALLRKGLTLRDVATQLEVDPRTVERWVAKGHLFEAAEEDIGVLVYSGAWLAEDAGLLAILRDRARTASACGCFGDPEGAEVISRSKAEGIDDSLVLPASGRGKVPKRRSRFGGA